MTGRVVTFMTVSLSPLIPVSNKGITYISFLPPSFPSVSTQKNNISEPNTVNWTKYSAHITKYLLIIVLYDFSRFSLLRAAKHSDDKDQNPQKWKLYDFIKIWNFTGIEFMNKDNF